MTKGSCSDMNDFIVTGIVRGDRKFLAAAYYEERKLTELSVMPAKEESLVGKIYVGYVESTVKNIGGAFIRISKDFKCFLPDYAKMKSRTAGSDSAQTSNSQGHMLVRITKDAAGVKEAVCSTVIELAGRYSVISPGKTSLSISKKLDDEQRELIKKWINPHDYPGLHILIRTNAARARKQEIQDELSSLSASLNDIMRRAADAKPGTCVYSPEPFYISMMRDLYTAPDRALSDIPRVAEELREYLTEHAERTETDKPKQHLTDRTTRTQNAGTGEDTDKADNPVGDAGENPCLIHPRTLTLAQLYNLEHDIDRLCDRIVWLKSGAYLVIDRTEAFVIIDINTGRCTRGKVPEETYRKINLEAGEEILRQLRLRELSGMVLIDFINLESEDHREELVNVMKKRAGKEHRRTEVFDLTKLGILEMVREKKGKPLDEVIFGRA